MEIAPETLAALRYEQVLAALAQRCRTEAGKARALARPFLPDAEAVEAALTRIAEARALHAEPLTLPLSGLSDVRGSVDRASRGGMLEPRELIAITAVLFASERTSELLESRAARMPTLAALGRRLPVLEALATRLDRSFEASGEISDRASVDLREARDRARGLHRAIRGRLDQLLHDEKFKSTLQEQYYSVRNDRYVVPVASASRGDVPGIVHNASQTGQTLFVEPQELIGLGNDLAIAQSVVLEEERKVLLELSDQVGRNGVRITDGIDALATLDEAEAAASLSDAIDANAPKVARVQDGLLLKGLRHPLLLLRGGEIIANDVELDGEARSLVISGPNAGGKTVTLTGVGLCALMLRAGLPIPAEAGSRLPLFNQVHSAVGDAQDLSRGLSTFSAHVSLLKRITESARHGALVLIDEIAADTDPREGAAIAIAVLEDLLNKGAFSLVTTHLEELKALAHLDKRFVNARVGFDPRKMTPTYRLQMGAAGSSSAIEVARNVGLDKGICDRAVDLAQNAGGALSKALAAADEERRRLLDARDAAEADAREAAGLKAHLEQEKAELERRRKEEEVKFRESLRAELEFARGQIRTLLEQLQSKQSSKAAEQVAAELTSRINEQTVAERQAREALSGPVTPAGPLKLEAGARAFHRGLDADVEILEVTNNQAVVAAGALKMRVPIGELSAPRKGKPQTAAAGISSKDERAQQRLERVNEVAARPLTIGSPTVDVRGMRADDALREVERFLDRVVRQGEPMAIVLHGHGTGALKTSVREYLAGSPYARESRAGESHEGGDGVTVVTLR